MEENKFGKFWLRRENPDKCFYRAIECEMVKQNYISNAEIFKRSFCDNATTLQNEIVHIIQKFFNPED